MIRKFAARNEEKLYNFNLDQPVFSAAPQDCRPYFLCREMFNLMMAVMNFAKRYVNTYPLNNLKLMGCDNLIRAKNKYYLSKCDTCHRVFRDMERRELFLLINEDNGQKHNLFQLICGECAARHPVEELLCLQLYPKLTLKTLEQLCVHRFITRYLFKIDVDYEYDENPDPMPDLSVYDVYESFKKAITSKLPHEQIIKIMLVTYEKTLFTESIENCYMIHLNDKIVLNFENEQSEMVKFATNHKMNKNVSYFYYVYKRVYRNQDCNYVVYFARPFVNDNRSNCVKCRSRYLSKKKLMLYCSNCGFANRLAFNSNDPNNPDSLHFYPECVKAYKTKFYCAFYYDLKLYEHKRLLL
nr:major early transcription gene 53 [Buzura suppressaria nucleopolyhedrovirus]